MDADWNHDLPREAYAAALRYELSTARTREHKAAIVEELERISGGRTGDENRSTVETAGQAAAGPQAPSVVESTGPESQESRRARHADDSGFDGR